MRILSRVKNTFINSNNNKIFFLHIPKCAGISLTNAIVKQYISLDVREDKGIIRIPAEAVANVRALLSKEKSTELAVSSNCVVRIPEYLLLYFMSQKKVKLIAGHVPFSEIAYTKFHDEYEFVTILRDPVKRWLSEYMFNKFKDSAHRKDTANMDIDEYIESDVGKSQGRQYVLFLGGRINSEEYSSKASIKRAVGNIKKFSLIGCVENMQDFADRYFEKFSIKLSMGTDNANPRPEEWEQKNITQSSIQQIENICESDCEIYYQLQQYLKYGS